MEWLVIGANTISMILCAIILDCYFSIFGTKKIKNKIVVVLYNLIYIALGTICTVFIKNQIIHIVVMFLLTIIYSFTFTIQVFKRIYATISIQIIMILSEFLFSLLLAAISGLSPEELGSNIIVYMIAVALSKVTIFAIIKPISMHKTNKTTILPKQIIIGFIILPITSFAVMFYMTKALYVATDLITKIIGFCISLLLILSNTVVFFLFENILRIKDKEQEMTQKAIMLENEKQYYSDLYEKQSAADKVMHDLKHKVYAFKELLDEDSEKAKDMVESVCSTLNEVNNMKITGKASVDSLLNNKIRQAKEENIDIKITSLLTDKINIDDIDLCVILGNLLDNSIEACVRNINEINNKIIVKLMQDDDALIIKIDNTFDDKQVTDKTSKKDKYHHGFGVQNVKDIIDKYNGYYSVDTKNNMYSVTIMLEI